MSFVPINYYLQPVCQTTILDLSNKLRVKNIQHISPVIFYMKCDKSTHPNNVADTIPPPLKVMGLINLLKNERKYF